MSAVTPFADGNGLVQGADLRKARVHQPREAVDEAAHVLGCLGRFGAHQGRKGVEGGVAGHACVSS